MEETAAARAQATQQLMTLQASHRQAIARVEHESMCHERQAEAAAAQATEAKSRLLEFGQELHSLTHMHAELQDARLQVCSVPALSLSLSFSLSLSPSLLCAPPTRCVCQIRHTAICSTSSVYPERVGVSLCVCGGLCVAVREQAGCRGGTAPYIGATQVE